MALKTWEFINLLLAATTTGMFVGPWLALTRSFNTFEPDVMLAITRRLNTNMAAIMTPLMPLTLVSFFPVLFLAHGQNLPLFYVDLAGFILFAITLGVTLFIEVPKVQQMVSWTASALPEHWRSVRDSWVSFHLARVVPALVGLALVLAGALFLVSP